MSINSKINAYMKSAGGRKKLNDTLTAYQNSGVDRTASGQKLISPDDAMRLARTLGDMIIASASSAGVPPSVLNDIRSMVISVPSKAINGEIKVEIGFSNDLHRESLYDEGYPDGVYNIIALFNNGYLASDVVYGFWDGHGATGDNVLRSGYGNDFAHVRSKIWRPELHFMQDAVENFNSTIGAHYNATATLADIYNE